MKAAAPSDAGDSSKESSLSAPLPSSERPCSSTWAPSTCNRVPVPIKAACFELQLSAPAFIPCTAQSRDIGATQATSTASSPKAQDQSLSEVPRGVTKRKVSQKARGAWRVYTDGNVGNGASLNDWRAQIKLLGHCETFATFEQHWGKHLDMLQDDGALRVFRSGIEPAWEDVANTGHGAGKWTIVLPKDVSKIAFRWVLKRLMEDVSMEGVNGVISMCKGGLHVLQLWTRPHAAAGDGDPHHLQVLLHELSNECAAATLSATFKLHPLGQGKTAVKGKPTRCLRKARIVDEVVAGPNEDSDYEISPELAPIAGNESPQELVLTS